MDRDLVADSVPRTPTARAWGLCALCAGTLMVILDQTVVNVALPAIRHELDLSQSSLAWVVNAFLVPFGGALLLAGRLGDLLGPKRVFITGVTVFVAASLLSGLVGQPGPLFLARALQGVGGALASSVILGLIVTLFPGPGERARAIGIYSFVGALGGTMGLLLGGALTDALGYRGIFFINVPIGLLAIVVSSRVLDEGRVNRGDQRADWVGAILVTSALMLVVYAILEAPRRETLVTVALGAASALLLVGFVVRQARVPFPLLPLRIFQSRAVATANLVQALMVGAMFGFQFLVALYMQRALRFGAADVGLGIMPVTIGIAAFSILSASLQRTFGATVVLLPALGLLVVGLGLLARAPVAGSYFADVFPSALLLGAGVGLAHPALMTLGVAEAAPGDTGLASGLFNTTQQVGGAVGLAALAALASSRTSSLLDQGHEETAALTDGYRMGFGAAAAVAFVAWVVAALLLRRAKPSPSTESVTVTQTRP